MGIFDRFKKEQPEEEPLKKSPSNSKQSTAKPMRIPTVYKGENGWKSEHDPDVNVPIPEPKTVEAGIELVPLRENLLNQCSIDQLAQLVSDLDLQYTPTGGKGKHVRELMTVCKQQGKLQKLLDASIALYPDVAWQKTWE